MGKTIFPSTQISSPKELSWLAQLFYFAPPLLENDGWQTAKLRR